MGLLARRERLVLGALGHDVHLARPNFDGAIPKIDAQLPLEHDEGLVRIGMLVPDGY